MEDPQEDQHRNPLQNHPLKSNFKPTQNQPVKPTHLYPYPMQLIQTRPIEKVILVILSGEMKSFDLFHFEDRFCRNKSKFCPLSIAKKFS